MIDIHAPMELDDGTPVTLVSPSHETFPGIFSVKWTGRDPFRGRRDNRHGSQLFWFRIEDGRFDGGDKESYSYVVNSFSPTDTIVEDWS